MHPAMDTNQITITHRESTTFYLLEDPALQSCSPKADLLFLHLLLCFSSTEHYRVFKKEC